MTKTNFTKEESQDISRELNIDFNNVDFTIDDFNTGMNVELEHGTIDPETNVTNDDSLMTGKIALAHLREFGDYYIRLDKMEREAEGKPVLQ